MNFPILEYIRLNENLINQVNDLYCANQRQIDKLKDRYFKGYTSKISKLDNLTKLAITLKTAEKTLQLYHKLGIDESIFKATFDDIRIWCENCNSDGLDNIGWIKNHVMGKLFKIGRLQYQMFTFRAPRKERVNLPLSFGEKSIYIHIPQGEKLDFNACLESISMANAFFSNYFPKHTYTYYFCESWLLYEPNKNFINPNSNIAQFMSLFDIHNSLDNEDQAFERIFGADRSSHPMLFDKDTSKRLDAIRQLPEQTSLQKAAKQYLLDGNKLGVGLATINKNNFQTH